MVALCNRRSSCCERLSISTAAETSLTSFARSRYSGALLLSLNAQNTALDPDVCRHFARKAFTIGPGLPVVEEKEKRKKRPYRAGCRHRGKTVDTKHPLTRYTDKTCSCSPISDGHLPTNLEPHVCSAQHADHVISWASLWVAIVVAGRKEMPTPWRSLQAGPDYPRHCHRQIAAPAPSPSLHFDS